MKWLFDLRTFEREKNEKIKISAKPEIMQRFRASVQALPVKLCTDFFPQNYYILCPMGISAVNLKVRIE